MNRARAIGYVIVYASSKSEELFGYHHGELVGTPVTALDAPGNERQDVAAEMLTALDQSGEWRGEVRLARKDGTSFWCDSSISTFGHAAHGRVRVSVHTDITVRKGMERQLQDVNDRLEARVSERTRELRSAIDELSRELLERKLAQEALRQSQVRLGSVISQAPVILWAIGAGGVFTLSEGRGLESLGFELGELVGRPVFEVHPDAEEMMDAVRTALAGEASISTVHIDDVVFDTHRSPVLAPDGSVMGVIGVSTVVTEREQAERKLATSQARFAEILEITENAVISIDRTQRITMFNTGAEHIFGYGAREVLGRPLEILLPERHRNTPRKHIADFEADSSRLRAMGTHRQEIFGLRKVGREFPAEASISKLEQDGEFLLTVLLADVTERTAAEQALQDSNRRLEETLAELRATRDQIVQQERLKALGTMASGIAHDFNNMLLPIVAFANLLLAKDKILEDRDRTRQYLGMIRIAGIDAADVVGRQREFYRGHDAPETFSLGDLSLLVKNVVDLTRPKWWDQAQATGVGIGIRIAMGGPKFVPADESGLRSLLTNLVFNAVGAMPGGGKITIQSRLDGCHVVLEIGDTGIGMSEETRRRCLDLFFTTKGDQGTGHGLAIVHGIVQRHAGSIDIASESGKGTAVSIRLPTPEQAASAPIVGGQGPHVAAALRILLVDDDPSALVAVCELLESDDNTVVTASPGSGALDRFVPGNTEVVMTDRAMPDMNGDKLANAIKLAAPATPVIMLTGFGDMMEADDERSENVDLILRKPVALLLLRKALVEVTAQ